MIEFETAAGLNDFRNNALRDSLYELVPDSIRSRGSPSTSSRSTTCRARAWQSWSASSGASKPRGGKIVLYRVQPIVRDLLAVMKLDQFFIIVENEPQALASLRPVPTA